VTSNRLFASAKSGLVKLRRTFDLPATALTAQHAGEARRGTQFERSRGLSVGDRDGLHGRSRHAYRRVEPQRSPPSLPRVPDRHDLLRVGDCLTLGFGPLGLLRGACGCPLPFLCATVRTHAIRLSGLPSFGQVTISPPVGECCVCVSREFPPPPSQARADVSAGPCRLSARPPRIFSDVRDSPRFPDCQT
jgi:hypothetical protein